MSLTCVIRKKMNVLTWPGHGIPSPGHGQYAAEAVEVAPQRPRGNQLKSIRHTCGRKM